VARRTFQNFRDAETEGFDDFASNQVAWMRWILHGILNSLVVINQVNLAGGVRTSVVVENESQFPVIVRLQNPGFQPM
jgi:hypothetical protein